MITPQCVTDQGSHVMVTGVGIIVSSTFLVPKMKLLHSIVIPKISSEWKTVADFLELEFSIIEAIEEKCKNDSVKCCQEMLREWLKSDHGLQPKTWSTLIQTLKAIQILCTVGKEVEQELKCKFFRFFSHACSMN